jgi:TetR/AcrR family transcriptional repressor of mexJK operon
MMKRCNVYVPETLFTVFETKDAREAIYTVGKALFSLVMNPESVSMYRMMVAESIESPKLASTFFKNGPQRIRTMLEDRLAYLNRIKALDIKDPVAAADVMIALIKGGRLHQRILLNIGPKPTKEEVENHIQNVTDVFMRAFSSNR